jgi:hypothetical protein
MTSKIKPGTEVGLVTAGRSQTDMEPVNRAAQSRVIGIKMLVVPLIIALATIWN